MKPRTTTDFGREVDEASMKQCIAKMDFITHRLDLEKKDIPRLLNKYLTEISTSEDRILPERYMQELRHFGFSSDV